MTSLPPPSKRKKEFSRRRSTNARRPPIPNLAFRFCSSFSNCCGTLPCKLWVNCRCLPFALFLCHSFPLPNVPLHFMNSFHLSCFVSCQSVIKKCARPFLMFLFILLGIGYRSQAIHDEFHDHQRGLLFTR